MKAPATVLLLVAVALSGCATDDAVNDFSRQSLTISFLDLGDGFSVVLPLWISAGTSHDDWLETFRVTGNATISIADTDRGTGLRVDGTGNIRLDAQDLRNFDRPEAFTNGEFSLGAQGQRAFMQVLSGDIDVTQYHYEGTSQDCFVTITQFWSKVTDGWHAADSNSRRSDPRHDCI